MGDGTFSILQSKAWLKNYANNTYRTRNILEAARFRKYADSKTENIFKKLLLKSLPLPAGRPISPEGLTWLPFQEQRGIPHILSTSRTYLAHQPGLGKTAQAIGAVNWKPGIAVIICPSFLKVTWAREITKWFRFDFPCIEIIPDSASQSTMNWNADFIICSDAMLLKEWVRHGLAKVKARYVFIDEGHRFKTPGTARTTALFGGQILEKVKGRTVVKMKSPGLIYNAEHVCVLSGTPMLNKTIELWPILYSMAPELIDYMSYQDFGFRYGDAIQDDRGHWIFSGSSNEDDLNKRIMGKFMQRIRKEDVLKDLPAKVREIILVDRDTRAKDIRELDKSLIKNLDLENAERPESMGEYAIVRHETGIAKAAWVAEFVYDLLTSDLTEQIILFAHHRDVVAILEKLLFIFNPLIINGGVSEQRRTNIQDAFQNGKNRLIIGNIDAMNLGLTLTKARRVIFAEFSWTPALNEQAEDRAHRIGQLDSVFAQYIVMPNSLDEVMLNSVLKKQESIKKVIG